MRNLAKVIAVSAIGLMSLVVSASPAQAVSFPDNGQAFIIRTAADRSLCLEVEKRNEGRIYYKALIPRACNSKNAAQQFTYEPSSGYLRNASTSADQCVNWTLMGYAGVFLMGRCGGDADHFLFPAHFTQTTSDAKLQIKSSTGELLCVWYNGEGRPVITQTCESEADNEDFILEVV